MLSQRSPYRFPNHLPHVDPKPLPLGARLIVALRCQLWKVRRWVGRVDGFAAFIYFAVAIDLALIGAYLFWWRAQ